MKRVIGIVLAIVILIMPSLSYADSFIERIRLTDGRSQVYKKFRVAEGEYISIDLINKADGGVTVFIEDEEGNRVYDVATLENGFDRNTQMKDIKVDLPKGKYFLRAEGKYIVSWLKNYNEETNGFIKIKFKTVRYKR